MRSILSMVTDRHGMDTDRPHVYRPHTDRARTRRFAALSFSICRLRSVRSVF
jgi:hypothetical protein